MLEEILKRNCHSSQSKTQIFLEICSEKPSCRLHQVHNLDRKLSKTGTEAATHFNSYFDTILIPETETGMVNPDFPDPINEIILA